MSNITRYEVRDIDQTAEIAALKAERDRLGSYNSHLIADREVLFAENTRLRAGLQHIYDLAKIYLIGEPT
jgi:hypothetical protein